MQVHHVEIEGRRPQVVTADFKMSADLVIVTGPIDVIFGFCYGPLEWRGYRVEVETVHDVDSASRSYATCAGTGASDFDFHLARITWQPVVARAR